MALRTSDRLKVFSAFVERAKLQLKRLLPFRSKEDPGLIKANEISTNNPVGKEICLTLSNKMVCSPIIQSYTYIITLASLDRHYNADIRYAKSQRAIPKWL